MEKKGKGYDNYSMSNNAREAYDLGEKPLSKWTKKAIIYGVLEENDHLPEELLKKVKLSILKTYFLKYTCSHHTSKFYNSTSFYEINEEFCKLVDEYTLKCMIANPDERFNQSEQRFNLVSKAEVFDQFETRTTSNHKTLFNFCEKMIKLANDDFSEFSDKIKSGIWQKITSLEGGVLGFVGVIGDFKINTFEKTLSKNIDFSSSKNEDFYFTGYFKQKIKLGSGREELISLINKVLK